MYRKSKPKMNTKKKTYKRIQNRQYVKNMIPLPRNNIEQKYIDTTINDYGDTIGRLLDISNITSGTSEETRIGLKVFVKSIFIQGEFIYSGTGTPSLKVCLVYDRLGNGTQPIPGNNSNLANSIFDCVSGALRHYTPLNISANKRYVIIKNYKCVLQRSVSGDPTKKQFKIYHKFNKGSEIKFIDSSGSYLSKSSGGFYLVFMSDVALADGPPTVYGNARLRFTDD